MSVKDLDSAMNTALAKCHSYEIRGEKAQNPLVTHGTGSAGVTNYGYEKEFEEDQYEHYRGRFYAGSRLVVQRLASQPTLVGRRNQQENSNSASQMIDRGYLPPNGVPQWLGDPRKIEVIDNHPLAKVLRNPNKHQTAYNFWEMVGGSIMATGRGFMVCMQSQREDRTWDLFPIPATWMHPIGTDDGIFSRWMVKPPGVSDRGIEVDGANVAHAYFQAPDNPLGAISPLSMIARSVLTDEAISASQYSEFINEAMPKVALIAGDVMNETGFTDDPNRTSAARPVRLEPYQREQIITWFQQQYSGAKKRGLPIVLDAVIRDLKILSRTPEEMGYVDSAGLTKEQIFEGIGVSNILTGQLDGVTRASGALAEQFFMDYCFNPILNMISQSMTKKLGPLFSTGGDEVLAWIAPGVHRDTELDLEMLRLGIRSYSLTRNDVRGVLASRFPGISKLEGMDDVIIPEKLEERLPEEDVLGVGRMSIENQAEVESSE
jgi:phage portal protein BeeE